MSPKMDVKKYPKNGNREEQLPDWTDTLMGQKSVPMNPLLGWTLVVDRR